MGTRAGAEEKIESVEKLAKIVEALVDENVPVEEALQGVGLTPDQLTSPQTAVSLSQILTCCQNAIRLSRDPRFAYRAGLRSHITWWLGAYAIVLGISLIVLGVKLKSFA